MKAIFLPSDRAYLKTSTLISPIPDIAPQINFRGVLMMVG
jgi:hypothetical protein